MDTHAMNQITFEQTRLIVENANEAIVVVQDQSIQYSNPAASRFTGYSTDDLRQKPFIEFIHPDDRKMVAERHQKRIRGQKIPEQYSFRVITKNGDVKWARINAVSIEWEGKPATLSFMTDVTALKKSEEALQSSEHKWHSLFKNMRDGWLKTDMKGNILECNPAFEQMLGYSETDLQHKRYQDLTPSKWQAIEQEIVNKLIIRQGFSGVYQKEYIRKDGSIFPVELSVHLDRDDAGQPVGMWGIARDISERRQAENRLAISEQIYRLTLTNINDAIFITDDIGDFTFIGPGTSHIFGYSSAEVEKMENIRKLLGTIPIDPKSLQQKGEIQNLEHSVTDKNGRKHILLINAKYVMIGEGSMLFTCHDVTERKAAEQRARAGREHLFTLLNVLPGTIYLQAPDYSIRYANDEFKKQYGDDLSRPCYELIHQRRKPCENCPTFEVFKTGKMKEYEWQSEDGKTYLTYDYPFSDVDGSPLVLEYSLDITERKQAEEQFRQIWDNSPLGKRLTDSDGRIVKVNEAYCKLVGKSRRELEGQILSVAYAQSQKKHILDSHLRRFKKKTVKTFFETEVTLWNGKTVWQRVSNAFIKSGAPPRDLLLGIFQDISDRKNAEDILKESEQHLTLAQKIAHIGSWKYTLDTQELYWSDELYRIYGLDPRKSKTDLDTAFNAIHPDDKEFAEDTFGQAFSEGKSYDIEYRIVLKNGTTRYIRAIGNVEKDNGGNVLSVFGTGQDITEQKQTEMQIQKNEERYKAFYNATEDMVFIKDGSFRYIMVNEANRKFFGKPETEIIGKTDFTLMPRKAAMDCRKSDKAAIEENRVIISTETVGDRVYETRKFPVPLGDKTGVGGFIRDITEIRKAVAALKTNEAKYHSILNNSPNVIFIKDTNLKYLYVNRQYEQLHHITSDKIFGMTDKEIFPEDQAAQFSKNDLQVIRSKESITIEESVNFDDGLHTFLSTKFPLADDNGKVYAVCGIATDITDIKKAETTIRKNEEILRNIFENSVNLFYSHTPDHVLKYVSPQVKEILGYTPEEAMQKWTEFASDNPVNENGFKYTEKAIKTGKRQVPYELELVRKDGRKIWVDVREYPIVKDGKTTAIAGSLTDITHLKKAEEQIRQSHQRFQELFDRSRDGFVMVNAKGEIINANRAYCKMLGHSLEELEKMKNFYEITPKKWRKWEQQEIWEKRLLKKGYSGLYEKEYIRKDGSIFPVELQSYTVFNEDQKPEYLWGVARDITERKEIENAVRESEEKHRLINQNIPVLVYAALPDEHSTNIFLSGQAQELTGYSVDELLKDNTIWAEIIHPEDSKRVWEKILEHRNKKSILNIEYRIVTKEGKEKWIHDKAKPLLNENGEILQIQGVMEDITERKRAEDELRKRMSELEIFNEAAVDRELLINEHRREINELLKKLGQKPKYDIVE